VAQTVTALGFQLASDPSQIIVIGVGMVDALFGAGTVESYRADVREAVATVRAAGKQPALRGFNQFAANDLMTAQRLQRLDAFQAALRAEAAALGVPFIDVGAVPFFGASDIRPDGLHPTPEYHQRIAQFMAARLGELR
jgi:lysophospholipase L1-like esterase